MALSNTQTITNTVTVIYEYQPDPLLPPVEDMIEASVDNTVAVPIGTITPCFCYKSCMCFSSSEPRCISDVYHNISVLSYQPIAYQNTQGLYLQALETLKVSYYSKKQNRCLQYGTSRLISPFIELPPYIAPSQVQSITASTLDTHMTELTSCKVNVVSNVVYAIVYVLSN